jgi:hypothetical protein
MLVPYELPSPGVHMQVTRPGYCSQVGADETMRAEIVTESRQELWVDACLRAPGLAHAQATVWAMLRSLRTTPVTVAVDGTITSSGGLRGTTRPIAGAEIRFVGTRRSITVRADGHGEFLLSALPGITTSSSSDMLQPRTAASSPPCRRASPSAPACTRSGFSSPSSSAVIDGVMAARGSVALPAAGADGRASPSPHAAPAGCRLR